MEEGEEDDAGDGAQDGVEDEIIGEDGYAEGVLLSRVSFFCSGEGGFDVVFIQGYSGMERDVVGFAGEAGENGGKWRKWKETDNNILATTQLIQRRSGCWQNVDTT